VPLQCVDDSTNFKVHATVFVIQLNVQYKPAIRAWIKCREAKCSF
jgi:hypothetical protein